MNAKTRKNLPPEVAHICWQKGTEPPFSGKYNKHYANGSYHCVNCDTRLFASDSKYDSGSGWPSFWDATINAVRLESDHSLGMLRTEVLCNTCGAHLGHVFDDGPQPTGKRYCINSLALEFHADEEN